jgi:hypothetical protein
MKIGKKFNAFSISEYIHYIENYAKYVDFNILGIYRSILENEKLTLADKIIIRDFTNNFFQKTFDFLQLKDPYTYFKLSTLGEAMTKADERQFWNQIRINQEKILKNKKIKHRNFGIYSKHNCGYANCNYNGLMIKQGSALTEDRMFFDSDKNKYCAELKSKQLKRERKNAKQILQSVLDFEIKN